MKTSLPRLLLVLALILSGAGLAWPRLALAAPPATALARATNAPPAVVAVNSPERGLAAANALTTVTGVAISPMMGVGVLGAWDWWRTPAAQRQRLHWYAHPAFWIPALLLVLLVAVKDVVGTALPVTLKRPFDIAEAIENKISGLVAAGAFVPLIATIFTVVAPADSGAAAQPTMLVAGFFPPLLANGTLDWLGNLVTVPLAIFVFALVWMVSNTINLLILISPWGALDAALKAFRLTVLAALTGTAFVNPYVGALFSAVLIVICWCISGWSFRLLVFGNMLAWDLLTGRRFRFTPTAERAKMFLARRQDGVPVRTYGKLFVPDAAGNRVFEYRPWLVLPRRKLILPAGDFAVGRGLLYPEVFLIEANSDRTRTLMLLPPRFRGHEEELVAACGFKEVRDVGMLRGLKGAWRWLKELLGWSTAAVPVPRMEPAKISASS